MTDIRFKFDKRKAVETLIYIARRIDHPDYGDILKLVYLADKTSLEKYGRFIFGDTYSAMKYGAVPSQLFDLVKDAKLNGGYDFGVEGYRVTSNRDADVRWLSESDTECLDQIITIYDKVPSWKRINDTHDEAYHAAWDKRGKNGSVIMPVESIVGMFESSDELLDYLANGNSE